MACNPQNLFTMVMLVFWGLLVLFVKRNTNQGTVVKEITSCTSEFSCLPNYLKGASQDDPRLIEHIRNKMLIPPSPQPYDLKEPERIHFSQSGQSRYADITYLHGMKSGFFIEAGAVDGELLSNSLYFERELGWRGLLIEPVPITYKQLLKKHRNAYSINVALSVSQEASEASFIATSGTGMMSHLNPTGMKVTTLPLYSILKALNVSVVDFLSLDIEGFEVKILKTLPWDKVKFRLMCIEINHIPEGTQHLTDYLTQKGYVALGVKGIDAWFGLPELLNQPMKPGS